MHMVMLRKHARTHETSCPAERELADHVQHEPMLVFHTSCSVLKKEAEREREQDPLGRTTLEPLHRSLR